MLHAAKHDHPRFSTLRSVGFGLAILCMAGSSLASCSSSDSESITTTEATAEASTESESTTTTAAPATLPSVSNVFAPPTDPGQDVMVDVMVSLSITGGATEDSLVGVSISEEWAESAKLVPDEPVVIAASQTVTLTKSGAYIELVGLKKALKQNRPFEITLKFKNSPEQTVQGTVRTVSLGSS